MTDAGATGMPGVMASQPTGAGQMTALPIILSSDAAGAPVFIAASPAQAPMFAPAPLTPLPSPGIQAPPPHPGQPVSGSVGPATVKSTGMSLPLHAPPPATATHGIFFQHFATDPSAPASAPVSDVTSPVFDFPTSPGSEMCIHPPLPTHPLHPANMTSFVH